MSRYVESTARLHGIEGLLEMLFSGLWLGEAHQFHTKTPATWKPSTSMLRPEHSS